MLALGRQAWCWDYAYAAQSSCADYQQDRGTHNDVTRTGFASTHSRVVQLGRPGGSSRRAWTESPRREPLGGQQKAAHDVFGDLAAGLSPYPHALVFPQDEHARLLVERLAEAGVEVERRTELLVSRIELVVRSRA